MWTQTLICGCEPIFLYILRTLLFENADELAVFGITHLI